MTALPVELAHKLALRPASRRWLIEGLWGEGSVGIVGGEPKCCKSFLALDMAVSVVLESHGPAERWLSGQGLANLSVTVPDDHQQQ